MAIRIGAPATPSVAVRPPPAAKPDASAGSSIMIARNMESNCLHDPSCTYAVYEP